ncbi:MAG: hypothetical protein CL935_05755 [Deltaproteobacteria bacterium]|nr:hypothetical protein [Deltaproteobacteria bacterium]|tara:strand:- start:644 stop:1120 length:477 start_codon:yes stop_codon:yes gene_type:complete
MEHIKHGKNTDSKSRTYKINKEKMAFKTKVVLVVLLVALLIGVPPGLSQQSPEDSQEDLYSIWIKLSMMGHNQSEIEGILAGINHQQLQRLKNRLRRDVLNTLTNLNLSNEIDLSKTEQDLVMIRDKIRTEIRFAGLENDLLLQRMIRHKFGIGLENI